MQAHRPALCALQPLGEPFVSEACAPSSSSCRCASEVGALKGSLARIEELMQQGRGS